MALCNHICKEKRGIKTRSNEYDDDIRLEDFVMGQSGNGNGLPGYVVN